MKRLLALFLTLIMCLSVWGCGNTKTEKKEKDSSKETTKSESTEEEGVKKGDNMIIDGGFDNGIDHWNMYTNGGNANTLYKDQQLVTSIHGTGSVEHGVQVYYDGFALDTNCVYKLSFDISASVPRTIQWRIQINGGDYHAYTMDDVSVTEEVQHVEKEFTMEEASDPAPRFCFNMGKIKGDGDLGDHEVRIDNVSLVLEDDSNKIVAEEGPKAPDININQVGYKTDANKIAVLRGDDVDSKFKVVNVDSGDTVLEGDVKDIGMNASTKENSGIADFTEIKEPGTYKIVSDKNGESDEFKIGDDVYDDLLKDTLKMLYMQRCGVELTSDFAGDYAHAACHTGEATIYGTSDKKEVSGGWHDAGDYGRYVVSGAKAVADLMLAYENNADVFDDNLGIPESGNGTPDVLDEAKFELDWLLKMQDETTGGVYHKVTTAAFGDMIFPDQETDELILSPISLAATGDFAAVMAMAGRVFKSVDADYANTCLEASKRAIEYLKVTDYDDGFKNPEDITTGEYPDKNQRDEKLWAYAEYYKTTGDSEIHNLLLAENIMGASCDLGWAAVGYYGVYAYLTSENQDATYAATLKDKLASGVKKVTDNASADAYQSTMGETYVWGSNMNLLNNGMLLALDDTINGSNENEALAAEQVNYVLGKNGNGYCFVTGYGTLSPDNTHHRPSQAISKTMKGMLVGGADSNLEDPYAKAVLKDAAPALCYVDNAQSFSCNEITVYWNSPLVYVLSTMVK